MHSDGGSLGLLTDRTTVPCRCGRIGGRLRCWFERGSSAVGRRSIRLEKFPLHGVCDCLKAVVGVKLLIDVV
jgi:hypothetical protein